MNFWKMNVRKTICSVMIVAIIVSLGVPALSLVNRDNPLTANFISTEVMSEFEYYEELANLTDLELEEIGYEKAEIESIREYRTLAIDTYTSLNDESDERLYNRGYTDEQIAIIRDFEGTEEQLRLLAATCTITISCPSIAFNGSSTNATLKVNFSWSNPPLIRLIDIVAVTWNNWFLTSTPSMSLTYQKLIGGTTLATAPMHDNSTYSANGCAFSFALEDYAQTEWLKSGSTTIYLNHNHIKWDMSAYTEYGHTTLVPSGGFSITGPDISFGFGISTAAQDWVDKVCP